MVGIMAARNKKFKYQAFVPVDLETDSKVDLKDREQRHWFFGFIRDAFGLEVKFVKEKSKGDKGGILWGDR
jgi:hypothetical protein